MAKLYRIWFGHGDGNKDGERKEIARIKAYNVTDVIRCIKSDILKNEVNYYADFSFSHFYLILDVCKNCDLKDTDNDICDDCEYIEFIEIEHNDKIKECFKVDGENKFYDLTLKLSPALKNMLNSVDDNLIQFTLSRCKK